MWHSQCMRILFLATLILAGALATSRAQDEISSPLEGNWTIEWSKKDKTPVNGTTAFGPNGKAGGRLNWSDWVGNSGDFFQAIAVEGDTVRGETIGHKFELTFSADKTVATGVMDGRPTTWRRVMERIDRIEVGASDGKPLTYERFKEMWTGVTSAGNLPRLILRVEGSGLPKGPNDVRDVVFAGNGFSRAKFFYPEGSDGTRAEITVGVRNPTLGAQTFTLNGRPFDWTLDLAGAETICRGIELTSDKATVRFGERFNLQTAFTPEGCEPPETEDSARVRYMSSDETIVTSWTFNMSLSSKPVDRLDPLELIAKKPGEAEITARFESLTGKTTINVEGRPPCTALKLITTGEKSGQRGQVTVGGELDVVGPGVDSFGLALPGQADMLLPMGCSVGGAIAGAFSLDQPTLATIAADRYYPGKARLKAKAPGSPTVIYKLGDIAGFGRVVIAPQPACDRIELEYEDQFIQVGETLGYPYRGGVKITYSRSDALADEVHLCVRPPGAPYFEAVSTNAEANRTTGAVTALGPGDVRVGVVHDSLFGFAKLWGTKASEPCSDLDVLVATSLAPTHRDDAKLIYRPFGCLPPPGAANFSVQPVLNAAVTQAGTVTAIAPGKIVITVKHGALTKDQPIEIGPFPPCNAMTARFEPPEVSVGQNSHAVLDYSPKPCVRPADDVRHNVGVWPLVAEVWDSPDLLFHVDRFIPNPIPITFEHGSLSAPAELRVKDGPKCKLEALRVVPDRLEVYGSARLEVDSEPRNCSLVREHATASTLKLQRDGGGWVVHGVRGGVGTIIAEVEGEYRKVTSNTVTVTAPACRKIRLSYFPNPIIYLITAPELAYEPAGCLRPEGMPVYSSSAPALLQIMAKLPATHELLKKYHPLDEYVDYLVWRRGASAAVPAARITVTHGALTTTEVVTVDDEVYRRWMREHYPNQ